MPELGHCWPNCSVDDRPAAPINKRFSHWQPRIVGDAGGVEREQGRVWHDAEARRVSGPSGPTPPSQAGKLVVVTGASGGLGLEVSRALADAGAQVIVAARDRAKGEAAAARIAHGAVFRALDLADLASVRGFADALVAARRPLDLLVNNAGLAATAVRTLTRDGFELQFGVNYLGHFALTGLLLPLLRLAPAPRVVTVSSIVEKSATMDFDDVMGERFYSAVKAYRQSKLATLAFAAELQRRSDGGGWGVMSVAAHPGIATTELTKARPGQPVPWTNRIFEAVLPIFGHSAAGGAAPIVLAATAADVRPGGYYGPTGWKELKGPPGPVEPSIASQASGTGARLWALAERLTGVTL